MPKAKLHMCNSKSEQTRRVTMVYICHNCKHEVTPEDLKTLPGVKCPFCGGRILYKVRPPVVKRVKSN